MHGSEEMTADSEEVLDHAVNRGEPLEMGRGLEAPYLPFPLARGLMGHFGPIVCISIGPVHDRGHHGAVRGRAAAKLVRDQPASEHRSVSAFAFGALVNSENAAFAVVHSRRGASSAQSAREED